jgi:hypothetical protein
LLGLSAAKEWLAKVSNVKAVNLRMFLVIVKFYVRLAQNEV